MVKSFMSHPVRLHHAARLLDEISVTARTADNEQLVKEIADVMRILHSYIDDLNKEDSIK